MHAFVRTAILSALLTIGLAACGGGASGDGGNRNAFASEPPPSPQPPDPFASHPNILLVIADDVGLDASSMYAVGDEKPITPTLDALARDGLTFNNAWANPVCVATRATILTGRYGLRTGVVNNTIRPALAETSIQEFIDTNVPNTYSHAVFGKWHLADNNNGDVDHPNLEGADRYAGLLGGRVQDYYRWPLIEDGRSSWIKVYATTKFVDLAIDWIGEQQGPWFVWLAFNAPHGPLHLPPMSLHTRDTLSGDPDDITEHPLPYYLAAIEALDSELGRLLESLSANDRDNTVIIYLSDNGTPQSVIQGHSRSHAKRTVYEGGVGVPLIVAGHGVSRRGEREHALVGSVDLYATIAELAGAGTREINDSKSFARLLAAPGTGLRSYAYAEFTSPEGEEWAIRNERFKLVRRPNVGAELYDLDNDPFEENNLIGPEFGIAGLAVFAHLVEELRAAADLIRQ